MVAGIEQVLDPLVLTMALAVFSRVRRCSLSEGKAMRVVLLVLIVLWPATAPARWVGTAEQWADLQSRDAYGDMDNWFNSLSSKKAGSCCSNFDGRPPEAVVQTSDQHYQVMLEGQWVDVPDDAVLDVPNKYGKALVWYSKSWRSKVTGQEGDFYIRCFLPGELY